RDLQHFGSVKWLFEDEQAVSVRKRTGDIVPRVIRICRANDRLQLWRSLPKPAKRFDPVPPGRHSHVNKSQDIWIALAKCIFQHFERFLALRGGIHAKSHAMLGPE